MDSNIERVKDTQRVTWVGFIVNLILSAGKIAAGFLGHSSAMLADGIHSLSDFITDVVVIVFIRLSGKDSDSDHAYGHGKYETFATLIIAVVLSVIGLGILFESASKIAMAIRGEELPQPEMIALWAALISIVSKEILYQYTMVVARRINSQMVMANAWHHRSDAFSSIGATIGISGAIFLGPQWRVLDPVAGVIVSLFIMKVAYSLAKPSMNELLEQSLPTSICSEIVEIILNNPDVISYHKLKTRRIGLTVAIDVHIQLNRNLSFTEAHNVTIDLEKEFRKHFGNQLHINIHAEPIDA